MKTLLTRVGEHKITEKNWIDSSDDWMERGWNYKNLKFLVICFCFYFRLLSLYSLVFLIIFALSWMMKSTKFDDESSSLTKTVENLCGKCFHYLRPGYVPLEIVKLFIWMYFVNLIWLKINSFNKNSENSYRLFALI